MLIRTQTVFPTKSKYLLIKNSYKLFHAIKDWFIKNLTAFVRFFINQSLCIQKWVERIWNPWCDKLLTFYAKAISFLINSYIVVATYLDMFSVSYSRQIFIAAWEKTCQKYSISAQIGQCLLCPITSPLSSHKILCIM